MFVDDIIGIAQKNRNKKNRRHVRSIILHAIDDVFHPLVMMTIDNPFCRKPVSLKKLEKGDCSWSTIKVPSTHVQFLPCLVTSVQSRPTTPKRDHKTTLL